MPESEPLNARGKGNHGCQRGYTFAAAARYHGLHHPSYPAQNTGAARGDQSATLPRGVMRQSGTEQREAATETPCLLRSEFDSRAFGFPFYRVARFDEAQVRAELSALSGEPSLAVDAKTPADDVIAQHGLMRLGFRKVCMQVVMEHGLGGVEAPADREVHFAARLDLDEDTLWAHARNFRRDRFSLDPLLPSAGRYQLYYQWLRNSLSGGREVAHIGAQVCTFSRQSDEIVIDLVSILQPRRGYGSRLMSAVVEHARQTGATRVRVTTECENTAGWSLYLKLGFLPARYNAVFHLVRTS